MSNQVIFSRKYKNGLLFVRCHNHFPQYDEMLQVHYMDPLKVDELILGGDFSYLGKETGPSAPQQFEMSEVFDEDGEFLRWQYHLDVTSFYHRDWHRPEYENAPKRWTNLNELLLSVDLYEPEKIEGKIVYHFDGTEWTRFDKWDNRWHGRILK